MSDDKECFFIAPIGDEGSKARERSNKVMEYVVKEAVSEYGYSVTRADQMDQPGSITNQVIQKTVDSDLVIADLTGHNPNVFYELAVRHATGEPYIQLIKSNESIPFDISDLRTIKYGLDVDEADQARGKIRGLLQSLEDEEPEFDNPISESAEMQSLRKSADPADQNLAEILDTMYKLDKKINNVENMVRDSDINSVTKVKNTRFTERHPEEFLEDKELEIYDLIKDYQRAYNKPVSKDELILEDMNKSEVEDILRELMMGGHVYEPVEGAYKVI